MRRKQLHDLHQWYSKRARKPLVIRGARQVGKSTLVKLFAEDHNIPLVDINLDRHVELQPFFAGKDPVKLLNALEALPNVNSVAQDAILFFDEIQAIPDAIPMLRYFFEDMRDTPVLAAGSLLEFVLSDHNFSMPVGRVQYLPMGPMTFMEFLEALGESKLINEILGYEIGKDINTIAHGRLLERLRDYFFVGGMPEAVDVFVKTGRLKEVSEVHNSIIETYREDFPKYCGSRNLPRMLNVFNFAARNVGVKVKYSNISRRDQSKTIKKDLDLLCMARVISKVKHSHCSGLPLQADMDEKIYKILFMDIGLMNAICGLGWNTISQFDNMSLINKGAIAEQFIGQHLLDLLSNSPNREINYWLREGKSSNAEVDYVISLGGKIIPIEVKSGSSGSLKSLHQFVGEKNVSCAIRFDAGLPSTQFVRTRIKKNLKLIDIRYKLVSLPLYLTERLPDLVGS
ncbi:Predicted ATPase (AAA+ superfamily) [hydrothermal vent metagenome]|uniref:Predicted ATPase (AAA+ superfamily) n=1 Tax=hydrothermal vent metagenome TaxID=652676 RepID=A0A3B0Z4C1_9ZZZZ